MKAKCMECGKPAKWVKWSNNEVPSKIIYGFCSKTCIANKSIKFRNLKKKKCRKQEVRKK